MRLVSFQHGDRQGFGLLSGDAIVDLTGKLSPTIVTLKQAIASGLLGQAVAWKEEPTDIPLNHTQLLPVIPNPGKILCIGLNYEDHRNETKRPNSDYPTVFTRFAESQVGHGQPLLKPAVSDRFDYEAELAIVIGKAAHQVSEQNALDLIAGYACYNDGSVRDWQRHTSQFTPGKNFPGTGGFGPALVTPDEVGDYRRLPIQLRLNGQVMQEASLADLIFPIEKLIAYCSSFTPLAPGDVIVTGTPGGVGDRREPPIYLQHGDLVEVDIGVVGCLTNRVATGMRAA
ncbi:fumarylacetoacetate hydrolase family protein [Devosia sp. 1566]|uniref:fumarylacetoacetate hydrolase family protein n=1 Tax=Devosia sp. 1566 TaxID=2499144 RepID=UPI000FD89E3F|nr:fumarylacetoacetate hydrolase family protein [Devosia sp. 1566]